MKQGQFELLRSRTVPLTLLAAALGALGAGPGAGRAAGQSFRSPSAQIQAARRSSQRAGDGPNQPGEADAAARNLVDGLFTAKAPEDPLDRAATRAMGVKSPQSARRPAWSGRLVRNPRTKDGNPPYALVDQYGGVRRYVEPTPQVDLERYVGRTVTVVRDTGGTLLATQLNLPRATPQRVAAGAPGRSGVRLAAAEEATPGKIEPIPAAGGAPAEVLPEGSVAEMGSSAPDAPVMEGEGPMMMESGQPMMVDESGQPIPAPYGGADLDLDSTIDFGGCPTCGDQICGGQGCALGGCGFGSRPIWYVRGEYLLWWFEGMETPPLVVRGEVNDNGTPTNATDDFFDNAFTVYGGNRILEDPRNGYRVSIGYWLDDYGKYAVEGDYVGFSRLSESFTDGGDGTTPIVGRPFIDATTGLPAVEDVSFPGISGTVTVDSSSRFQMAGIRLRKNLCCVSSCDAGCGDCVTCGSGVGGCDGCDGTLVGCKWLPWFQGGTRHVDVTYGVRWAQLDEQLFVREQLTTIPPPSTTFDVNDQFSTNNQFFGGEIGFTWDWQKRRWSLEMNSRLAIGNTRQRAFVNGFTTIDPPDDNPETRQGGLLTQSSNIGRYERNDFSVMPQLGVTLGYNVTDRLKLVGGYTMLYWTRVGRPGDLIDLEVNPGLFPFADTPDPDGLPARPQFIFRNTDIWAHGINAGIDYSW
jgi:hypothetical protein